MTKHKCNKEIEITEMQTNQKWIMSALKEVIPKINDIHDSLNSRENKITVLNKTIFGNGKPGVVERVEKIEGIISKVEGGGIVVQKMSDFAKWAIGILATGNILGWLYIIFMRII